MAINKIEKSRLTFEFSAKVAQIGRKLGCKDQESIQSSTTPDPGYQWNKFHKLIVRHHKREQRGQSFPCRCPQGTNKQTRTKA